MQERIASVLGIFGTILTIACETGCTSHHSVGLPVFIAKNRSCSDDDRRVVVIQVSEHRSLRFNQENVRPGELERRLQEIFKTRAYRFVFIIGERDLEFGNVAEIIDRAKEEVDHVAILTHSVLAETQKDSQRKTCFDADLPEEYLRNPRRK